jgi:ferrous iron transport protein B
MTPNTIALLGNPNCGKTTLFNALTGSNQRTGNWPGVTVEHKEGQYRDPSGQVVQVIDLPGIYSLDVLDHDTGMDECVARDYLLSAEADIVVNVVDASNLERNLYLTTQVLEMGLPIVIALNMMDVAHKRGIEIDTAQLTRDLGYPVVPVSAKSGAGIADLLQQIRNSLDAPQMRLDWVKYPGVIEEAIASLLPPLEQEYPDFKVNRRWLATHLLQQEDRPTSPELQAILAQERDRIHHSLNEDIDILIADSRYGYIQHLSHKAKNHPHCHEDRLSEKIDRIVLNRYLGVPIFLTVMYAMFLISINFGSAFIDFFDLAVGAIFVDGLAELLSSWQFPEWLIVMLTDGVGGGIQTVATFIPPIAFMFLCLAALEDSGYMARAAFVVDRLMRAIGLPGKAFVPMLVGFGCNVPAIMAARTLTHQRDRITTIMMNPFMSCGARLPVYAVFAAAFFAVGGQNMVFALYLTGILAAIFTGMLLKRTLLKGEISPFVMELPPYHLPQFKGVLLRTWDRLQAFIIKAGKVIVIMVLILGLLDSMGTDGTFGNQNSDKSLLSTASRAITPAFAPMGIEPDNWPATVGIFTGVFAKEAIVGSLDALYSHLAVTEVETATDEFNLGAQLKEAFATIPANLATIPQALLDPLGINIDETRDLEVAAEEQAVTVGTFGEMVKRFDGKAGAFAYLLFVLLYFPCLAATAAIYRETNWGWTLFAALWTTGLAYWMAVMFYQVATFVRHPFSSGAWIIGLLAVMGGLIYILHAIAPRRRRGFSLGQ